MLKLSIIFLITALLFLLFYLLSGRKNKKPSFLRRFCGFITIVSFIGSAVLCVIYCKEENITLFNNTKTYELPSAYTSALEKKGAEQAYPLLPVNVYSQNDNIYFINSQSDLFALGNTEGEAPKFITQANETVFIGGRKTLKATLRKNGNLILDGYFLYSKFDDDYIEYSGKVIAKNVKHCSATDNSLFYITEDGDLYAMGFNEYGQLGDTTTKNKPSPVFVMKDIEKADISDTHAMFIDKYGTLYAAGDNSNSQLGNKNAISSTEITKVMQGVKDVKVGNYFSLVLTVNGELYSAGTNEKGQLGNNGEDFRAELVSIMSGVEKISINGNTCAALTYNNELYVWGDNANSKAGVKDKEILAAPVKIQDDVYDFALSSKRVIILKNDRSILSSDSDAEFSELIQFNPEIPEQYKNKSQIMTPDQPENV